MKKPPLPLPLLRLGAVSLLLLSCGDSQVETPATPELDPFPAAPDEAPVTEDSAATSALDLDELMASLSGDEPLTGDFGNLSDEQRKTLQSAAEKAAGEIDLGLLTTAIEDQIGAKLGAQLSELSGSMSSGDIRVLTPEQAKELGIDLEKIGNGSASSVTIRTQVLPFSTGPGTAEAPERAGVETGSETEAGLDGTPEVRVLKAESIDDPEISRRIQQYLESGDSDALAAELKTLLQASIDGTAINQLLEPPTAEKKAE